MSDLELSCNSSIVETLKSCDRVVKKQVDSVKQIRKMIVILNVFMSIVAVPIAYIVDENPYTLLDYNTYYAFTFVCYIILVCAVFSMRRTIKEISVPKERFVIIHLINFSIYMLLYACRILITLKAIDLNHERLKSNEHMLRSQKADFNMYIVITIEVCFFYYMLSFLLYLITCFAKENKVVEVHDTLLGRKVPTIVYLQNKRLMKDAIQRKVERDSETQKALILQA